MKERLVICNEEATDAKIVVFVNVCCQGTSVTFYKRFYLHNSVMDYHPKDIMYVV